MKAKAGGTGGSLYFALLSGKHPCLSTAEFEALLPNAAPLLSLSQTQLFNYYGEEHRLASVQESSSTIKYVGRVLAVSEADVGDLEHLVRGGGIPCELPEGVVNVAFARVRAFSRHVRKDWAVDTVREYFRRECGRTVRSGKPRNGYVNVTVVVDDGLIIIGQLLAWKGKGGMLSENPHDLPYYAPGALNRWLTNLLINLATGGDPSKTVWDPFCGTGTLGLPHLDRGGAFLCSEIVSWHCKGALKNMVLASRGGIAMVVRADAAHPITRARAVDAVVTDLPYGRSVRGMGWDELGLARRFLEEVPPLLRRGGKLVFMAPMNWWGRLRPFLGELRLRRSCPMYVHEGLTRIVVVSEKP